MNDIADQKGRIAIVTGSSSGIGLETARVLAGKGAKVILAVRNLAKGEGAAERIKGDFSGGGFFWSRGIQADERLSKKGEIKRVIP